VALNGTVPSYPQYLEAAAAARRVAGVKKLNNHLEVALPTGEYRDDATLTTAANNALRLNVAVPDGVEATARNGNLILTGTVNYGTERTAAEQAVAYLTGVRNVNDEIAISTDADPVDVTLNVQDALAPVPANHQGMRGTLLPLEGVHGHHDPLSAGRRSRQQGQEE
jgi:hypothetical protein